MLDETEVILWRLERSVMYGTAAGAERTHVTVVRMNAKREIVRAMERVRYFSGLEAELYGQGPAQILGQASSFVYVLVLDQSSVLFVMPTFKGGCKCA